MGRLGYVVGLVWCLGLGGSGFLVKPGMTEGEGEGDEGSRGWEFGAVHGEIPAASAGMTELWAWV